MPCDFIQRALPTLSISAYTFARDRETIKCHGSCSLQRPPIKEDVAPIHKERVGVICRLDYVAYSQLVTPRLDIFRMQAGSSNNVSMPQYKSTVAGKNRGARLMDASITEPPGNLVLHGITEVKAVWPCQVPRVHEIQDPCLGLKDSHLVVVQAHFKDRTEI